MRRPHGRWPCPEGGASGARAGRARTGPACAAAPRRPRARRSCPRPPPASAGPGPGACGSGEGGLDPRGVDPARVHRVGGDPQVAEPARPLLGQHDLRPLRARVDGGALVRVALGLQVVDVERLRVHAARGDRDDARGRTRAQGRGELRGECERPDDVRGERQLDPVARERALGHERAGVVDEDVERVDPAGDVRGGGAQRGEVAEIADDEVDVRVRGGADDLADGAVAARGVAREDEHLRAQAGEAVGGRPAEAAGRAGDEDGAAVHARERVEAATAREVAEARVAGHDRGVHRPVDDRRGSQSGCERRRRGSTFQRDARTEAEQHGAVTRSHPASDARPDDGLLRTAGRDREGRVDREHVLIVRDRAMR